MIRPPVPPLLARCFALTLGTLAAAMPAGAVLDIEDRGPSIQNGSIQLRVTNAGVLGNAFFNVGRSTDASFEHPPGSGREALNYASLWVGGRLDDGTVHVSGGSLLEFRPTPDPEDRVRVLGSDARRILRFHDDDNDGAEDEETLDGRDEDGDGEVDEDLGVFSQHMAVARYVDDRPEAVAYVYPGGEVHRPLGISVRQEVFAWALPGYDRAAGVRWVITNHSGRMLRNVYVGVYADLDSRFRSDAVGHLDDRVEALGYSRFIYKGGALPTDPVLCRRPDNSTGVPVGTIAGRVPVIADRDTTRGLPFAAFVPFSHTVDALAHFDDRFSEPISSAPHTIQFRYQIFQVSAPPTSGGPPITDEERYHALASAGADLDAFRGRTGDWAVLISCGPFSRFEPGQSLEINGALIASSSRDSLLAQMGNLALIEHGIRFNLRPDDPGPSHLWMFHGETGIHGHEACLRAPSGVTLIADPHCLRKFEEPGIGEALVTYPHDGCLWTDADCNACTGIGGFDTEFRWITPALLPPPPSFRVTALDGGVRLEWDNYPEVLLHSDAYGWEDTRFLGYRVWKVSDWHDRQSLMPDLDRWSLVLNAGEDAETGAVPLAVFTDSTLDYDRILYERPFYPVGRYAWVDREVRNGFDYAYFVSAVYEARVREPNGYVQVRRVISPIRSSFDQRVTPGAAARDRSGGVHVVPNPYRGRAAWDRAPVFGDAPTSHVDFVGLPRALCTIKVWTIAGDLVAVLSHDARSGSGQAPWNLISRNGQDVASGVYVFTVESSLGSQVGRFVVIR